jgi:hypothetical protein
LERQFKSVSQLAVLAPQNGHEVKGGGTVDYDLDAQLRRAEEFHATDS